MEVENKVVFGKSMLNYMPFFYFNLKFLKEVTPKNFLNILKGDKEAMKGIGSGKVIDRCVKFSWKEVKCVKKTMESSFIYKLQWEQTYPRGDRQKLDSNSVGPPGLEVISGESLDTMTSQIHFSSVTYRFWPVKFTR